MAVDKKNSIFFAGGKTIEMVTNETDAMGLKMERNSDLSWKVTLEMEISATEAQDVIRTFKDLNVKEDEVEDKYPNQIYFVNQDNSGIIYIDLKESKLSVYYDKVDAGGLIINLQPVATGKTQNPKTQNPVLP